MRPRPELIDRTPEILARASVFLSLRFRRCG